MNEISKTYDPTLIEERIYSDWLKKGYFKAKVNKNKKPYTIVIPPPNVTGMLTIGHVLNNTLQDVFIRYYKLKGFETCWVPGTDHASIATEAKVTAMLKDQGIDKKDLGREEFLLKAKEWKDKYGGIIIQQLKKLGCACDWDRERFTMDDDYYKAVIDTFVDLYKKGLIYKGYRLVNWCPGSMSVISDEEVEFVERKGHLWYFKYPIKDSNEFVTVATTRPETMFGDTAVAIHPENEKLKHLIGKTAILPLVGREIPIIADTHADPEKGTGAVKITPGHDPNDNLVGQRHGLQVINVMNPNATLNDNVPERFRGLDRFVARKKVVAELQELGLIEKIEDHVHQLSISQRGKEPIEYLMSEQWYLKMSELVKPAIEVVNNGRIKIHPEKWIKTYNHWLDNVQDWCLSRQLWWGHRIPVYYCSNPGCETVRMVESSRPSKCEKCGSSDHIRQDEDVLDTWSSSWIWPYAVFRTKEEQDYFYPTDILITGPDIIFFWVARMIIAGMHYKNEIPFKDVYFNGMVRDEQGRKMSKSLGNSPDPLDVIRTYGADALRFTMIRLTPVGNDIFFSENKCDLGKNFANKLWNAARFLMMNKEKNPGIKQVCHTEFIEDKWINSRLNHTIETVEEKFKTFQLNDALKAVYEFLWNDLCDWYIEMAKSRFQSENEAERRSVLENALYNFDIALRVLHPFMPFITEELWLNLDERKEGDSIMLSSIPDPDRSLIDVESEEIMETVKDIIGRVRNIRAENNIIPSKTVDMIIKSSDEKLKQFASVVKFLAKIEDITFDTDAVKPKLSATSIINGLEIYIPLEGIIDLSAEKEKIEKEIARLEAINAGINAKLSNEQFVSRAPDAVLAKEREKLSNNIESIAKLKSNIENFI
ncbi:MAG TPA: valine--tRNA ligase [Clostridiales bacterium]|nr:valine--tRNA ligase [Clostridiales bacterium]HQP69801.1 valine--tRNA ligase [Clostridiales bacterium]